MHQLEERKAGSLLIFASYLDELLLAKKKLYDTIVIKNIVKKILMNFYGG
jgi:hypothetical protein